LREDIKRTQKRNEETIMSIERDTNFEKEDIEKKNQHNQTQVNDMKLKSTAECQLNQNKLADIEQENSKAIRAQQDKEAQVKKQEEATDEQKK
jgi:hypothetical protein